MFSSQDEDFAGVQNAPHRGPLPLWGEWDLFQFVARTLGLNDNKQTTFGAWALEKESFSQTLFRLNEYTEQDYVYIWMSN